MPSVLPVLCQGGFSVQGTVRNSSCTKGPLERIGQEEMHQGWRGALSGVAEPQYGHPDPM